MNKLLLALALLLGSFSASAADLARLMFCQANAQVVINQATQLRDAGLSYNEAVKVIKDAMQADGVVSEKILKNSIAMLDFVYSSKENPTETGIAWFNECVGNPKI